MQEEIERQTLALVFKAGKLTAQTLSSAIHKALEKGLSYQKSSSETHGKMSVAELVGKGNKTETLDFKQEDLRLFQKTAAKYNVDYAVHKTPGEKENQYTIFFQAKDLKVIESAFQEFLSKNEKKKESVQKKLDKKQEIVNKRKNKERAVEKHKNKELSR